MLRTKKKTTTKKPKKQNKKRFNILVCVLCVIVPGLSRVVNLPPWPTGALCTLIWAFPYYMMLISQIYRWLKKN